MKFRSCLSPVLCLGCDLEERMCPEGGAEGISVAKRQDTCKDLSSSKATKALNAHPITPLPPPTPLKQNLMAFTVLELFVCMLRGASLSPWAVVQSIWRMQDLEIFFHLRVVLLRFMEPNVLWSCKNCFWADFCRECYWLYNKVY